MNTTLLIYKAFVNKSKIRSTKIKKTLKVPYIFLLLSTYIDDETLFQFYYSFRIANDRIKKQMEIHYRLLKYQKHRIKIQRSKNSILNLLLNTLINHSKKSERRKNTNFNEIKFLPEPSIDQSVGWRKVFFNTTILENINNTNITTTKFVENESLNSFSQLINENFDIELPSDFIDDIEQELVDYLLNNSKDEKINLFSEQKFQTAITSLTTSIIPINHINSFHGQISSIFNKTGELLTKVENKMNEVDTNFKKILWRK